MAIAMTDITALLAAQPPLPISAEMDKMLQNNLFEGRSHAPAGVNHLPHFSPATLQFLKKLSPSLQKAALTAFRKTPKTTLSTTQKPKNARLKDIPYHSPTTTPSTSLPPQATKADETTATGLSTSAFSVPSDKLSTANVHYPLRKQKVYVQGSVSEAKVTPPSFHWGDIESDGSPFWRGDFSDKTDVDGPNRVNRMGLISPSNSDDAGIVLLVAIFNLLAVVIYAAHRHVTNLPSLPPRVLDWQVQKVLDELVLRVHSSSGAAKVLARALPTGLSSGAFGGRSLSLTPKSGLQILDNAKDFMLSVASSPAARNSANLPSGIYRPFTEMYASISQDLKNILAHGNKNSSIKPEATSRQLSDGETDVKPMWLQMVLAASELNGVQWDGILRTLTMIGRSRSLISSKIIAKALMTALASPAGSARNDKKSYLGQLQSQIDEIYERTLAKREMTKDDSLKRIKRFTSGQELQFNDLDDSRVMIGKGLVDDAPSLTGAGGEVGPLWAHRWFSLVTRLAPVALDATTLYARAHREPTCLRSLLCSINFSWKKVGPLQAALTPLLSVLTGWALEERMPHSLGESLEAIRSGWLGRNCAVLYSECTIAQAPDSAVRQALTYFSRLEFSLNENPTSAPFMERSSSDSDNKIIVNEDKKIFVHSFAGQRPHEPVHQLHPSRIDHFSSEQTSLETDSQVQNIPLHENHEENVSENNGYTNSRPESVHYKEVDHYDDESKAQSDNRSKENEEIRKPSGSKHGAIYVQKHVDHKLLDGDSYELYRKETYGPYVQTGALDDNQENDLRNEGSEDLTFSHRITDNEVDYHELEGEKEEHDHHWHREALETRPDQAVLPSPVQERRPPALYRRYDSPPHDSSEENVEPHSIIAGLDLQDAQLSRAEALTSALGSGDDRLRDEVGEEGGPSTPSPAESLQRQQQQVVYAHHVHSPQPVHTQKLNIAHVSSAKPVSRFALQNHKRLFSSSNFENNDEPESKSRVQVSAPPDRWRDVAKFASHFHTEKIEANPRKKLRGYFSTVKSRPLLPKSRFLFRSSIDSNSHKLDNVKKSNQLKLLIQPGDKANEKDFREDVSRFGILHHQRKNSKRPLGFYSTAINSFQHPSNSQHSRNLSVESSLRVSNENEYVKRGEVLPSDARRNGNTKTVPGKTVRKYMYGLRRGLPAVTVENYSLSKVGNTPTAHLRQRPRPWFTYSSEKHLKYPHKNLKKSPYSMSSTERPESLRHVEEFGPDDAITDEFKNSLLYQYIRDQVKEQPSNSQGTSEEKQEPEIAKQ